MEIQVTLNAYKAVFDISPVPCILVEPDYPAFTIADVNTRFMEACMLPKGAYNGRGLFDVLVSDPADPEAISNLENLSSCLQRAITSKQTVQQDLVQFDVHVPGTKAYLRRYWKGIAAPIFNELGDVVFVLYSPVDVTENYDLIKKGKGQEVASKVQKEFYQSVFKQAPVGIGLWLGPNFITAMVNPALAAFYQKDAEYLLGKPVYDVFPEAIPYWRDIMMEVLETGEPFQGEDMAVNLKVNEVEHQAYVNFGLMPYYEPDGRLSGVLGISIDTTKEVNLRKILEENEMKMKIAVESARLGVWDVDLRTRRVYSSSHIWIPGFPLEGASYSVDDFIARIVPEHRKLVEDAIQGESGNFAVQVQLIWSDQSLHWIQLTGNLLKDGADRPIRVVGTTLDITDRKELERRKDELLSTVSHELKTPVTSIKAIAQILEKKFDHSTDIITVDLLHKLGNQVRRLTNLIHDLLDASLIDGGKLQLNKSHFMFDELMEEVVSELQRTTNTHTIVFQNPGAIASFSDKERIRQVIINLLTNAIKYSPKADQIIVSVQLKGKCIQCCVEDFGIGIPTEKQSQIFDRFYRVIDDKHSGFQGIGIGLYISKQIISRLDGNIRFESKPNRTGTIFCFEVPQY